MDWDSSDYDDHTETETETETEPEPPNKELDDKIKSYCRIEIVHRGNSYVTVGGTTWGNDWLVDQVRYVFAKYTIDGVRKMLDQIRFEEDAYYCPNYVFNLEHVLLSKKLILNYYTDGEDFENDWTIDFDDLVIGQGYHKFDEQGNEL